MNGLIFTVGTERLTKLPIQLDLTKAPHMLVAGMTGSGKSVFMNAMITELLSTYGYQELRLVLIDPKRVELSQFKDVPHILKAMAYNAPAALDSIRFLEGVMNSRFHTLEAQGYRDIDSYNDSTEAPWPRILLVVDELANLMLADKEYSKPIERTLCDIAAMARAVGIHCVLATQRPDASVLTGLIRANVPTRVSFATVSALESRIILDEGGAEELMGAGNGLVRLPGKRQLVRFQGRYISEDEVQTTVASIPWATGETTTWDTYQGAI